MSTRRLGRPRGPGEDALHVGTSRCRPVERIIDVPHATHADRRGCRRGRDAHPDRRLLERRRRATPSSRERHRQRRRPVGRHPRADQPHGPGRHQVPGLQEDVRGQVPRRDGQVRGPHGLRGRGQDPDEHQGLRRRPAHPQQRLGRGLPRLLRADRQRPTSSPRPTASSTRPPSTAPPTAWRPSATRTASSTTRTSSRPPASPRCRPRRRSSSPTCRRSRTRPTRCRSTRTTRTAGP